ncbi:MAG: NTP transferase domain-containing protein [Bacteroidales bacterium]|nr:NTP transferase domain-containing protein [Bacteroidales bacterium]
MWRQGDEGKMGLQTKIDLITMIPTVMILAAGTGSRMRPLTDVNPKALLEFRGKPMLDHIFSKLKAQGFHRIVINIHHFAGKIKEYIEKNPVDSLEINFSDESERLMDTGGGIINARKYLEGCGPFIVHNVDIFSDIDLHRLYEYHIRHNPLATLAVRQRQTSRNLLVDKDGYLQGWRNNDTGETVMISDEGFERAVAFSGVQVIDPRIFEIIDHSEPFSIIRAYLELARDYPVMVYDHSDDTWIDMAHRGNYPELS